MMLVIAFLAGLAAPIPAAPAAATPTAEATGRTPRLAQLAIPGDPAFARVARDVIEVVFTIDPSAAAGAGLFDDALRAPSFKPAAIKRLVTRLDGDLRALAKMPWRTWPVDQQIDFRWIYANAELARRFLQVEKPFTHRPASWLEPFANDLIAFASYLPAEDPRPARLWAQVPAMVKEMTALAKDVTRRDRETARKLIAALRGMAQTRPSAEANAASAALERYDAALAALQPAREFTVIGPDAYAWRLDRALLLGMTKEELLGTAEETLAKVEAEIAELKPKLVEPKPSEAQKKKAAALDRAGLLALYDTIEEGLRKATIAGGFVTIPEAVGPVRARETPDAMVPLTGDGGSMNPPPPFVPTNVGYWNVEHFRPEWTAAERLETVVDAENWKRNGMGPYAAHEGFPGHHLQLAIARLHKDPIRSILPDGVQNEGWALYIEEELFRHGGFSDTLEARSAVLRSYRHRIARVIYDVKIETGVWTLQQGADFKRHADPGKGEIDEDVLRSIQWPTQLICYFTGKLQIQRLREDYKKKLGPAYSDRAFHDAFLAEGSIPVSLIRAKLLGEPVPGL